jgi:hypothetical protein
LAVRIWRDAPARVGPFTRRLGETSHGHPLQIDRLPREEAREEEGEEEKEEEHQEAREVIPRGLVVQTLRHMLEALESHLRGYTVWTSDLAELRHEVRNLLQVLRVRDALVAVDVEEALQRAEAVFARWRKLDAQRRP